MGENAPPGARGDWRTDVWGVASLLFALLRFEPPLLLETGDVDRERLLATGPHRLEHQLAFLPPLIRPELSRALAWDPANRHRSCAALADSFDVLLKTLESGGRHALAADRSGLGRRLRRWFGKGR